MSTSATRRRGRAAAALAAVVTAALVLFGCGSSVGSDTAPGGTPSGTASEALRVVDLLDTTFDLGALGIAPVAIPYLDRTFAERVLAELELPADIEQQILAAELVNTGDGISTERVAVLDPDVILLSETSVGTFKADPEALKQFGRVVFIPENLSWQERTKAIGEAVGRRPQAEKLVAEAQRPREPHRARRGHHHRAGARRRGPHRGGHRRSTVEVHVGSAGRPGRGGALAGVGAELRHRGAADHLRPHRGHQAVAAEVAAPTAWRSSDRRRAETTAAGVDLENVTHPHLIPARTIHLATAHAVFGGRLASFVGYDKRLLSAVEALGLPVASPGAAATT